MRRTPLLRAICLGGLLVGLTACPPAQALDKWGPFRGRIVDVETGQPLAGAAVLVIWWEAVYTPVQTNTKFYDAREAVTDADGRFEIPRLTPPFFTFRIRQPQVTYFAPGYAPHGTVVTPPDGQPFVAPTVVQLRRLKTREELKRKSRGYPSMVPEAKMPNFLRAIDIEDRMLWPGRSQPGKGGQP